MKEFQGSLKRIDPSMIVNKDEKKDLESFFLILGLIFNDLKGLMLFDILIRDSYRKPEDKEFSVHAAEFGGLRVHVQRLIIGAISEFLVFLNKNEKKITSYEFRLLEKKIPHDLKTKWQHLVFIAFDKSIEQSDSFSRTIERIRNNVVFHYDNSGKELRRGFNSFFYETEEDIYNKSACVSFGKNMEETRFYYCDASVQKYIQKLLSNNDDYFNELMKVVEETSKIIRFLVEEYLTRKR